MEHIDLRILDTNFQTIYLLDAYDSIVWTERYYEAGDFELFTEVNPNVLTYIQQGYYVVRKDTKCVMIVESIEIDTDIDIGNFIKITGRSLESILDRRIIWGLKTYNGNLQNGIKALINECIINPSNKDRKISNFIFKDSTDSSITSLKLERQWTGDNLYDAIKEICYENEIGFRISLDSQNRFVFELYSGVDRTYNQSANPYVIFSPTFENLINSNYYESNANYKNITLIGGQGEGKDRIYTTYGSGSGLSRRELFSDARDISLKDPDTQEDIPADKYLNLLKNRGRANLYDHSEDYLFEGEVESQRGFIYGKDFYIGDIVQIENEYQQSGETRILELVTSMDREGYSVHPTFSML